MSAEPKNCPPKPLDGVRVLDLATFVAAPFAAAILGEFGAEVIKVEHPDGGDPLRRFGTPTEEADQTLAWLSEARNKHSVTMDLKNSSDVERFKQLVERSDVVCENFRPGTECVHVRAIRGHDHGNDELEDLVYSIRFATPPPDHEVATSCMR